MTTPRGVAVNQSSGNVYAVDGGNNRIVEFNSSGEFLRAFGQDVVESGPDNNGTGYEICVPASGDTCKVGVTGSTGGALSSAQGVAVNQETGNLYVTDGSNLRVDEFGPTGAFIAAFGQAVVASGPDLVTAASAVQTLTVTATGGKYTLTFGGKTTAELASNASASVIQTALTGLSSIGSGNATVTEMSGGVYKVTFAGALANNPEPLITAATAASPNELTSGTATVANTITGATGFDVCVAANSDVCQAGTSASTGGAFKATFNGYVAVAPAGAPNAGDVLVADPANLRVEEFTPGGVFVRAFGFNAVAAGPDNNGTTNFEVCTAANGDACGIGVTGAGSGQFANSVNRVAEDSAGDIYTVESTVNFRVQKFTLPSNVVTPQGNFDAGDLKGTAATSAPIEVAIDPATNDVLVTKAFVAGATVSCPATGVASVAERRVLEVSSAGVLQATHMTCAGINVANGLAVRSSASTGDIYVSSTTTESRLYILNTPLLAPTDALTGISGITAHSATVSGYVNPNGPVTLPYGLATGYHVNYKRVSDAGFSPAPPSDVNVGKGVTNVIVSQQLPGLEANTTYEVQIVAARPFNGGSATTSTFSFSTPSAAPEVTVPTATTGDPTGTKAGLYGFVNPDSQATTYRFEYGTSESYGTVVPAVGGSAGTGAVSTPVSQLLTGLQPETTYHFRLRANNAAGGAASPDETFITPAATQTALPDNRAFELVSPPDKRPSGSVYTLIGTTLNYQGADNGESVAYTIQSGLANATAGGEVIYVAHRHPNAWGSTQASPPSLIPSPAGTQPSHVNYFSPNVTCGFVETPSPLTEEVPQVDRENDVGNIYRRNDDGSFTLVTNRAPINPTLATTLGTYYLIGGASPNCDRVYFTPEGYKLIPGASGLYEWHNGELKDAGILPDGTVAPSPALGSQTPLLGGESTAPRASRLNSVSEDGSRLFFSSVSDEGPDKGKRAVFMRKNGKTIDVSEPTTSTASLGARYEVATEEGTHVFLMSNLGLAGPAGNGPQENCLSLSADSGGTVACDIYDYDVETGQLTDLTTDNNPADTKGAVAQGIVGISRDGSYVYFAAKGQLVPGRGKTYAENIGTTKSANIYLSHGGKLSYVATVLDGDLRGGALLRWVTNWSAWVTPSGLSLLFQSRANILGYQNNEQPEAYIYSAESESLQCVSCRASGGLPATNVSVLRGPITHETEIGLHYSRPMSEDGKRVFFTSRDALAPGAVEGRKNVYEWEEGKTSLLASIGESEQLVDTSATGNDVFFTTSERLDPHDFDNQADLYDARVGGGFPAPEPASEPCDPSLNCQVVTGSPGSLGSLGSEIFSGPGDLVPAPIVSTAPKRKPKTPTQVRAEKLAKALKVCRAEPRSRRAACERQARKKYGKDNGVVVHKKKPAAGKSNREKKAGR